MGNSLRKKQKTYKNIVTDKPIVKEPTEHVTFVYNGKVFYRHLAEDGGFIYHCHNCMIDEIMQQELETQSTKGLLQALVLSKEEKDELRRKQIEAELQKKKEKQKDEDTRSRKKEKEKEEAEKRLKKKRKEKQLEEKKLMKRLKEKEEEENKIRRKQREKEEQEERRMTKEREKRERKERQKRQMEETRQKDLERKRMRKLKQQEEESERRKEESSESEQRTKEKRGKQDAKQTEKEDSESEKTGHSKKKHDHDHYESQMTEETKGETNARPSYERFESYESGTKEDDWVISKDKLRVRDDQKRKKSIHDFGADFEYEKRRTGDYEHLEKNLKEGNGQPSDYEDLERKQNIVLPRRRSNFEDHEDHNYDTFDAKHHEDTLERKRRKDYETLNSRQRDLDEKRNEDERRKRLKEKQKRWDVQRKPEHQDLFGRKRKNIKERNELKTDRFGMAKGNLGKKDRTRGVNVSMLGRRRK